MITEKNFGAALNAMGFNDKGGGVYEKIFADNVKMSANLKTKKLSYPAQVVNRDRNNSFNESMRENLVVFECVNRLLEKGYKPEDITLEKDYKLGHLPKSGRADICVSHEGKTFFIIECKTYGKEYDNAIKILNTDGGQLFAYRQQDQDAKWLMLYASNFDGELKFAASSVSCDKDNYKDAGDVQSFFKIWKETFKKQTFGDVIFHAETVAYKIGVPPFRKKALIDFKDTGIVNLYEEILRHNSVTNKQNAFDALLELFICKLADESHKADNQELDFQFKFGVDTFETFIDRLQRLYHQGMEEFMHIPTTYTPLSVVEDLLFQNQGENRKVLADSFKNLFNKLKFYTPNIFNFVKVLNQNIFYVNGRIVKEVVDKFKDYKIIGAKNLQTLGDLFEQLLDKGFKQDEGQFFTPLPVTRFIWDSLPLEQIISIDNKITVPKIIDYACGAGHFLTQGFEAINDFFKRQNISPPAYWEDEKLFGIEKNDRLSTVSKVALFMHGADKGKIKFGDGLENYPDEGFAPGTFDILVSNPPYSIKDFKQHLTLENEFDTLEKISISGKEIETLFVERIAQLLKPGGIAAVILPSSILNKDGKSFISAREKILQNFYVKAVAEFGSKTFGATGTKTNILFLQKISDPPERFRLFEDTVNGIFADDFNGHWDNEKVFNAWLDKIHVDAATYKKFILREVDYTFWQNHSYFGDYFNDFKETPPKTFSDADKLFWLNQKFYESAHAVEKEKIWYFAQTYTQTTLIISAPEDNAAQEKFLGYTWTERKGDEGIKISNEGGLLYDKTNRRAVDKLANAVRQTFYGEKVSIPAAQNYFYYLNLADMIDFSGAKFTKIIKLAKKVEFVYSGKYPLKRWEEVLTIQMGKDYRSVKNPNGKYPVYGSGGIISRADEFICPENTVVVGRKGTINKPIFVREKFWNIDTAFGIIADEKILLPEYLFNFCLQFNFESLNHQLTLPSLTRKDLYKVLIPVPPIDEQQKIVEEFRAVDDEISAQEKFIAVCDDDVKSKFDEMFGGYDKNISLSKICIDDTRNGEKIPASEYLPTGKFPIIDQSVNDIAGYSNLEKNFYENLPCIIFGDHTEIFKYVNEKFFLGADGVKILIPSDRNKLNEIFLFHMLRNEYKTVGGYARHFRNLNDTKFYLPPKELQEKFASYVTALEEKKFAAQKRIDELKMLREGLTEKYFR